MWPDIRTRDDDRRLDAISTVRVAQGGYVCSDRTYHETGRGRAVFFDVGISSNKRYASVGMGSATFGQRCLLRRTEDWSLVGCRILWIE